METVVLVGHRLTFFILYLGVNYNIYIYGVMDEYIYKDRAEKWLLMIAVYVNSYMGWWL
jgi:hypothetical protein